MSTSRSNSSAKRGVGLFDDLHSDEEPVGISERVDQHHTEDESGCRYGQRREPVMGPEFAQSWRYGDQAKQAANDRDGVKTGPLPRGLLSVSVTEPRKFPR